MAQVPLVVAPSPLRQQYQEEPKRRYCARCPVYHTVDGITPCKGCYKIKCVKCDGVSIASNPFRCPYCWSKTAQTLGVKAETIKLTEEELKAIVHPKTMMVCPHTGCQSKLRKGSRDKLRHWGLKR